MRHRALRLFTILLMILPVSLIQAGEASAQYCYTYDPCLPDMW